MLADQGSDAWQEGSDGAEALDGQDIRWLFVGDGAQAEKLKNAARERGYNSVMFRPYQPRESLSESLRCR